ncbi:hypothetical protein LSH36_703g00021 [Paralvinella palmiformis]|uniref:B box-type domain-containing protein n=1 Tax=Paralvinella palmiformis TaxID=53620 RepID=A0AAD9J2Y3_9ANNE|nr:hypothetical protein LSH36_703g00021 [Paralvinella palmiformis]
MLSCFHAFCKDCLQQKANNPQSPSTTSCPVCGQTTQVNGGFTASLPLFCFLKLDEAKNKLMRDRRCAIYMNLKHNKFNVSYYCFVCGYGHCENCHPKHDATYLGHTQIPVTSATIHSIFCDEHGGILVHFCITCTKAICSKCRIGEHSEHAIYELTYDAKNYFKGISFNNFTISRQNT